MHKHTMIGMNEHDRCCVLSCLLSFDQLDVDTLEASDFIHSATNWNGCDGLGSTLQCINSITTDNVKSLKKPLVFRGKDYDHGHEYDWTMTVTKILEVKAL